MSQEQIRLTDKLISWIVKGIISMAATASFFIFVEIKDDIKLIKTDLYNVRERVSHIEGAIQK